MNRHEHETPLLHAYFYLHNRVIPLAHTSAFPRIREYSPSHMRVHYLRVRHCIKSVPYLKCVWFTGLKR